MTDTVSEGERSEIMSKIHSGGAKEKWTKIERKVHDWLKAKHVPHVMMPDVEGDPDVVLKNGGNPIFLFLDGCFWHCCPEHYRRPKSRQDYWIPHVEESNERREERRKRLPYNWVRIWEHDIDSGEFKEMIKHLNMKGLNMKVRLVDADSEIPNLALMKISRYHKNRGDEIGFKVSDPDKVYVSVIFEKNDNLTLDEFGDAEVVKGGSGHSLKKELPDEIEDLKPDYSLYDGRVCQGCGKLVRVCRCKVPEPGDMFYSLGFTTRGCNRNCEFCVVPEKEGSFRINQHPKEFHDDEFDKIKLLDNNILFDKAWFYKVSDWIRRNLLKVDFNQGLDIRLMDQDIANKLSELSIFPTLKFAWDKPGIENQVKEGIRYLRNADINLRHNVQFYVLTNFDTTHEEDLYRCRKLKEWGTNPFVMLYDGGDSFTRKLSRWANKKWIFRSCDFEDYDRLSRMEKLEVKGFA